MGKLKNKKKKSKPSIKVERVFIINTGYSKLDSLLKSLNSTTKQNV